MEPSEEELLDFTSNEEFLEFLTARFPGTPPEVFGEIYANLEAHGVAWGPRAESRTQDNHSRH